MSGKKNNRQRQRRQQAARNARARAVAQRQHQEQSKKRRTLLAFIGIGLVAVLLLGVALNTSGNDTDSTEVAQGSSTTAGLEDPAEAEEADPPQQSAKGKPCVATVDPLPAGAPAVPVEVGPPPTTLVTKDLKEGTGPVVAKGAKVKVNYIGVSCSSGKIFDSSYGPSGKPIEFGLDGVIKGWTDGIPGMKVGGQRLLGIPSDQAYGPTQRSEEILADEALWFVVEVLGVS